MIKIKYPRYHQAAESVEITWICGSLRGVKVKMRDDLRKKADRVQGLDKKNINEVFIPCFFHIIMLL